MSNSRVAILIVLSWVVLFLSLTGCMTLSQDDMTDLRKQLAVQEVQMRDLRERVQMIEFDLDRIAPRTPVFQVKP